MYFLKNLADWRKWRFVFNEDENCPQPTHFPCFAYISADGDGREALYLYRVELWHMLGQIGGAT